MNIKWISTKEQVPPIDKDVLFFIYNNNDKTGKIINGYRDDEDCYRCGEYGDVREDYEVVTHFAHLQKIKINPPKPYKNTTIENICIEYAKGNWEL